MEQPVPGLQIVHGTPAELNDALQSGAIDVAPCSSIEYARHTQEYRLLPGLVIGADGPVRSIRFESARPIEQLQGGRIAVPTASATSVVLLRILIELRYGVHVTCHWFSQETGEDPVSAGFDGALWIGDLALQRPLAPARTIYDLGALWAEWTGLPFAFALWQTRLGADRDDELHALTRRLQASRDAALRDPLALAHRHASSFAIDASRLAAYWQGLRFELDDRMLDGLLKFYACATQLGEIEAVADLRFV